MHQSERQRIVRSWRLIEPIVDTATELFYRRLFELKPEYRALFPDDMDRQRRKLALMLRFIVSSLDWDPDTWVEEIDPENDMCLVVLALGRRHTSLYRVPDEAYAVVSDALLWTLDQGLGAEFDLEMRAAWAHLFRVLSITMRLGAAHGKGKIHHGKREPS